MTAVLSVRDMVVRFDEFLALDHVSLDVAEGESFGIVGESGSGKSTLLRALAGLVPHFHGGRFSGRATTYCF